MNRDGREVMLPTRWVLKDDCENEHRGMLPIYDVDICADTKRLARSYRLYEIFPVIPF